MSRLTEDVLVGIDIAAAVGDYGTAQDEIDVFHELTAAYRTSGAEIEHLTAERDVIRADAEALRAELAKLRAEHESVCSQLKFNLELLDHHRSGL